MPVKHELVTVFGKEEHNILAMQCRGGHVM